MKTFITYIPTFGVGQAKGHDGATVLADLRRDFPQFADKIEVREASEEPVLVHAASEDDLI